VDDVEDVEDVEDMVLGGRMPLTEVSASEPSGSRAAMSTALWRA
jgi:hypothetical protein